MYPLVKNHGFFKSWFFYTPNQEQEVLHARKQDHRGN